MDKIYIWYIDPIPRPFGYGRDTNPRRAGEGLTLRPCSIATLYALLLPLMAVLTFASCC